MAGIISSIKIKKKRRLLLKKGDKLKTHIAKRWLVSHLMYVITKKKATVATRREIRIKRRETLIKKTSLAKRWLVSLMPVYVMSSLLNGSVQPT